jgi:hypothetical protein
MGKKFIVRLTEQELADLITKQLLDPKGSNVLGNFIKGVLGNKSQTSDSSSSSSSDGKSSSSSSPSGSVESKWMDVTKKVIDNFEGGYWNYWECKNHPWHSMYNKSGETLFGLDRKAGAIESLGPEGREFFKIIDDEKKKLGMSEFCSKWTYNYRGGDLEDKLKDLAAKTMFREYEKNMSNYVKDPETKKRIEGNEGLLLHMSYATWNGPGYFKKFADQLDRAVKEGKSDEELLNIAKDGRTSSFTGAWAKATTKVNNLIDKTASSSIA